LGPCAPPFFIVAAVAENARRKAQSKASAPTSPLGVEAVPRIDALFEIERSINEHCRATTSYPPAAQRAAGRRPGKLDAQAAHHFPYIGKSP
jgi:hypothetical protein